MNEFPKNFFRHNFKEEMKFFNKKKDYINSIRKEIYEYVLNKSGELNNGIIYKFNSFPTSDVVQIISNELRLRGFKVTSNFDIYRDKQIMIIT
tara:strand:- start:290 stop:568 length:279 start_codon:yes stop_codon:yes gene_type:complete